MSDKLKWDNKVALVTGGGRGIGREYSKFFASRGAKVVVNDSGVDLIGENPDPQVAENVVQEIIQAGGIAVANSLCVTRGKEIVDFVISTFGRIDIIINNAGILCDVSFLKMTNAEWNKVITTHLSGTFSVCHAAWNIMREQSFGRIVNTVSGSGLYGSFGQANYSAAKLAILGLTYTLAREGEKRNILVNAIAPVAASRMTSSQQHSVLPQKILDKLHPAHIVPLVAFLTHETCTENGSVFELGAGYISKLRLQRSQGAYFDLPFSPEEVRNKFGEINNFANGEYPDSSTDVFKNFFKNIERIQHKKEQEQKSLEEKKKHDQEEKKKQEQEQKKVSNSKLKSTRIFDLMAKFLELGEGKDIVQQVQGTYNFGIYIEKGQDPIQTWIIDLKNGIGAVTVGTLDTADASFFMSDDDFVELCNGNLDPQQAFLTGKMKIKGNMKKATIFTPELFPQPTEENFQKYMNAKSNKGIATSASSEQPQSKIPTGLESEKIFDLLDAWLKVCANQSEDEEQSPMSVRKLVNATYIFQITKVKGGDIIASFKVNLKDLPLKCDQVSVEDTQADAIFILIDKDFVDICNDKLDPQQAFLEGKMKIKGNMKKATLFTPDLFPSPTPENFAKYLKSKL